MGFTGEIGCDLSGSRNPSIVKNMAYSSTPTHITNKRNHYNELNNWTTVTNFYGTYEDNIPYNVRAPFTQFLACYRDFHFSENVKKKSSLSKALSSMNNPNIQTPTEVYQQRHSGIREPWVGGDAEQDRIVHAMSCCLQVDVYVLQHVV